jgi:hypothetical protein
MKNLPHRTFPGQSLSNCLDEAVDLSLDKLLFELDVC